MEIIAARVTLNALKSFTTQEILEALNRHRDGDWGDLCQEDIDTNDRNYQAGQRVLAVYNQGEGRSPMWLNTYQVPAAAINGEVVSWCWEPTVMLPEDY